MLLLQIQFVKIMGGVTKVEAGLDDNGSLFTLKEVF